MERLLIFDLKGNIAHFRKFYTSSSSLSYSFPPRTTITGLIAGMLGKERDSYYEEFAINNCKIALSIRKPMRKIMQTVNYLRTKKEDGYTTSRKVIEHFIERQISKYPTPLELIVPQNFNDEIVYRIYFCYVGNERIMDELYLMLKNGKANYPIFLGLSEFLAKAKFIADVLSQNIKEYKHGEPIEIVSVCNSEHISELEFDDGVGALQYIDEKMPLDFASDREIKKTASFIHEKNQKPIKARLKVPYIQVTYDDQEKVMRENITFME
ncbi:MAG: type I-B CRISPR-associated protein Cas5b [Candidatus Omnitrophota bacterium]